MPKRVIAALVLALPLVLQAQNSTKQQVWGCQSTGTALLAWDGQSWQLFTAAPSQVLVRIGEEGHGKSTITRGGHTLNTNCFNNTGFYATCHTVDGTTTFHLDLDTGRAGISDLFGAVALDRLQSSPMRMSALQCTKF